MSDPLLSSLCTICHINVPKYKCPRCSVQTCSLPCSRRHKLWSTCSGVRDPTVFIPKSQLVTPSGVDHDYNFLHSIEHRIERSEKEIVEERGLVSKKELILARTGEDGTERQKNGYRKGQKNHDPQKNQAPGEQCINQVLKAMKTTVHRAPKGMKRNVENKTSWSRHQKSIHWTVEYIQGEASEKVMGRAMGTRPIGDSYYEFCERKAVEIREQVKRAKLDEEVRIRDITTISRLQNPETSAWNVEVIFSSQPTWNSQNDQEKQQVYKDHFYLLRPNTPSSFSKVLVPIDPSKILNDILRKRTVLEFPTIYVFEQEAFPKNFMLEKDFLQKTGQPPMESLNGEEDDSTNSSSEESDDETSSSESEDENESMDDGKIVG
ncbi:hypothetical protein G7Y89_g7646 [Cudoniella acicularis]|uniref:Box C/D snoRNA protein 1 n=1 Tax=Cudoniella acicularis TaxID=354080 RepID=A0A8H4W1C5_9HELO|nr:hypothetical protein G7Y89_g7646 [Cudoniella acicularis]